MPQLGLKLRLTNLTASLAAVYTTGLQMWHKLTATTWTGSNRLLDSSPVGTNSGALFTGRALDFDGVNDWIDCGNPNITCRSIVLYINPNVTTDEMLRLTSAINVSIVSGTLTATGWTSPTRYVNGVAATSVSAGAWQQIAITSATSFTVDDLELGRTSGTAWYAGLMSNVKIFSAQLTAAQVLDLYNNPEKSVPSGVSASDLVGWWKLEEGGEMNFCIDGNDNSNPGTKSGTDIVFAGNAGNAVNQIGLISQNRYLFFDGSNDRVKCTGLTALNGVSGAALYAEFFTRFTTGGGCLISLPFTTGGSNGFDLQFFTNNITTNIRTSAGFGAANRSATTNNGKIVRAVALFSGGNITVYVNGVAGTSVARTGTLTIQANGECNVGAFGDAGSFFNGVVSRAAAWSTGLTNQNCIDLTNGTISPDSLTTGLQGYWINKGKNNQDWLDSSGNNRNGTVSGSPAEIIISQGKTANIDAIGFNCRHLNSGRHLTNINGYAQIADANSLDVTTAVTVEAWVRPLQFGVAQTIVGKNLSYALKINSSNKPAFHFWSTTEKTSTTTTTALTYNVWAHIAATYDGTNVRLYINGNLDSTVAQSGSVDVTTNAVILGGLTSSSEIYRGMIDSAKIYNVALTSAQVLENYKAEKNNYI